MTYRKYKDDEDDLHQPSPSSVATSNPTIQNSIQSVNQGFKQIEQQLQLVQSKISQLPKLTDNQKILSQKSDIQQLIQKINTNDLLTVDNRLHQLNKQIKILSPGEQPAMMRQYQSLKQSFEKKKQQIDHLQQSFSKISIKIEESLDQPDQQQSLERFQMKQIQEQIDDQLDDIVQINREINDINQAMQVMAEDVQRGGETINIIENEVNKADDHVAKGVQNLDAARKHQLAKNKWLWIGLGIILIIVVVLLAVFLG